MSEHNKNLAQIAFGKYNSGLRSEVESLDFATKQDITNFVRSKLNKLYLEKHKKLWHKEGVIQKLKAENERLKEGLNLIIKHRGSIPTAPFEMKLIAIEKLKELEGEK